MKNYGAQRIIMLVGGLSFQKESLHFTTSVAVAFCFATLFLFLLLDIIDIYLHPGH